MLFPFKTNFTLIPTSVFPKAWGAVVKGLKQLLSGVEVQTGQGQIDWGGTINR